ncbi:MAG: riboflavin synthase [Candidatus Omnitrophica bacterium]|nr:riboflavin synthase [Candidatus Omnitrophota bacterium]
MFSGIVEEKGIIQSIKKKQNLYTLSLQAKKVCRGTKIGDSIAINGVCLTATSVIKNIMTFDLMKETLDATTFGDAKAKQEVNLERALKVNSRLGGHFVSGHVDGMGVLKKIVTLPNYVEFRVGLKKSLMRYIAPKGSVAIDGVSLTIGEVRKTDFSVYLIPHTLEVTTFGKMQEDMRLNIETDILAKYLLDGAQRDNVYTYSDK